MGALAEPVRFAPAGVGAGAFQMSGKTSRPFDRVTSDLKAAIEENALWVLQEINPQTLLRREGLEIRRALQILFFHPRLMQRVLEADSAAVLEAPLKIAVLDHSDTTVVVRCIDPASAMARYGNDALTTLGVELHATCRKVLQQAIGESLA